MRLSDSTRYPHPVLSPFNDDYIHGDFRTSFAVCENLETGALTLQYDVHIEEPSISELVASGRATVGCIVVSLETYYIHLHKLDWKTGFLNFGAGALLGDVSLRPIIWLADSELLLSSENINSEFGASTPLKFGDILAIAKERFINVGQAKLAPLESIFELVESPELPEGKIQVSLDEERISILLGKKTFSAVNALRGQEDNLPVVMSSIYLPAVMEVLDSIRNNPEGYLERRWYKPFSHKCTFKGVSLTLGGSSLEGAQVLLEDPLTELCNSRSIENHE